MNRAEIVRMQQRIGVLPDGFWGPVSIAACQKHLKDMMPKPYRFPIEGTPTFDVFYGNHGQKGGYTPPSKEITIPFDIYYEGRVVNKLRVHEKCADSLLRVFESLHRAFPTKQAKEAAGILLFNGIYNPRLKRGSLNSWSMHAWMIAIDINASKNGNKTSWPVNATMPIEVMECFAKEGWLSAGAFWGRDAMHFQATSPL